MQMKSFTISTKIKFQNSQLHCCGADSAKDWENLEDNLMNYGPFAFVPGSMSTEPKKGQTPASCCDPSKNNGYENNTCDQYYQNGCTVDVSNLAAETVLIVASVLLTIGALQVS